MELKKTKILYLITQSNSGGAQKYVLDLASNLDKQKYDVAVAAGGNEELFRRLENADIKIFKIKWLRRSINPAFDILAYFEIKKLLLRWQPDVVHLNSSKISVLGALAARNLPIKVIYTVHGAVFEAAFSWPERKIFLWLEKLTAKYKDKIICVSEYDRQLWLKYNVAPAEKLLTIHNGLDSQIDFLPKSQARQKLFSAHIKTPDDYQIVGWLGYFYPEKKLDTLIKAANLIFNIPATKDKKIIFSVIGNGPQEKGLKLQVSGFGLQDKILFLGAVPEARCYLKAFDIFVLPSVKEGLPYTILEAMAAGVPIIASDVGGIPEMIADNFNGFLIHPKDFEALAEKILQILENSELTKKFSQNSLERIKEFSLNKMLQKTQQQY